MDIHDESSTIREAFEFSALLRQRHDTPKEEKLAYVETVLHTLDLIELQNAVIGSLDIEKKKRVTIGVELCARPRLLLFLDEPTSGLDSQGATSIVALLRRLADQGLAVLCTIHQANQQQFEEVSSRLYGCCDRRLIRAVRSRPCLEPRWKHLLLWTSRPIRPGHL